MRWIFACIVVGFSSVSPLPVLAQPETTPPSSAQITPADWLKAQPKPKYRTGHTLPPLTRYSWDMDFDVRIELAESWGYAVEFSFANPDTVSRALTKPESREAKLLALSKSDPKRYPLCVASARIMPKQAANDVWTRNAEGRFLNAKAVSLDGTQWNPNLHTVYSPVSPDSYWEEAGKLSADLIRQIDEQCPIAVVLNTGEYGLGTPGFAKKVWELDPEVMKAKGERSWNDYISERKGHQQGIMSLAEKNAAPKRQLYMYYTAGGGVNRNTYPTWGEWEYKWEYMKTISDFPSNEMYYHHFNSGFTGPKDMLTLALNAAAREIQDGKTLSYNWLSAGWEGEPGHSLANLTRWTGFLKCYYTAGMIGGNEGFYQFLGKNGFSKPFPSDKPPHWLLQLTTLAHVHALFSNHEDILRNGDLLPGPDKNKYTKTFPAYEFPTGDPHVRVLARKHRQRNEWLVTAWAADGDAKTVNVSIPPLGRVTLLARPQGTMYQVTVRGGRVVATVLDKDDNGVKQ